MKKHNRLVIKKRKIFGDWYWKLIAKNGRKLTGDSGFNSIELAQRNIELVEQIFKTGDYIKEVSE